MLSVFVFGVCACQSAPSREPAVSPPFPGVEAGSLFSSYEPLQVELDAVIAPLKSTEPNRMPDKSVKVPGKLTYVDERGERVALDIEASIKGFSSTVICSFPKLELKIRKENATGNLFEKTKTVDLHTHCVELSDPKATEMGLASNFYAHREALLYRMAEVLKIPTLKARPILIKYKNSGIATDATYRGFFLGDLAALRKRLSAREIQGENDVNRFGKKPRLETEIAAIFKDVNSSPQIDREDVSRVALFQSMIVNGDWHIKIDPQHARFGDEKRGLWNTKIIETPDRRWVVIPQDFNFAGILFGSPYSTISKEIWDVSDKAAQARIKQEFLDRKTELYNLIETLKDDSQGKTFLKSGLDRFFEALPGY